VERVIGIDVGKVPLDVYCLEDGRRLAVGNDAVGVASLVDQLGLGARDLVVMEASGGDERRAHRYLSGRDLRARGGAPAHRACSCGDRRCKSRVDQSERLARRRPRISATSATDRLS
jgi:transposase